MKDEAKEWILTESIDVCEVGEDHTASTFWISDTAETPNPKSMMIHPWNGFATGNWSYKPDYSPRQRWHIVKGDDMAHFDAAASAKGISDHESGANVRPLFTADIYDLTGRLVKKSASSLDGLAPGATLSTAARFCIALEIPSTFSQKRVKNPSFG